MIDGRPNPEQRTLFISEFENYHDAFLNENVEYQKRIDNLTQKLARYKTPLSSGVLLSNWIGSELHNFNENRNGLDCQELLLSYHNNSDALAHSSLSWYFQKLLIPIRETSDSRKIVENRLWFLNSSEMTFIKITPVSFHQETETNKNIRGGNESIMKEFWIADREVSVGKFREFTDDNGYPAFNKPVNREGIDVTASPAHFGPTGREIDWSDNMAVQQVNWYDAIMYCNWLSNREGYVSCYEKIAEKETGNSENAAWRLVPGATGYRLPSESEWEFACRAGTTTDFSCGNDQTLLVDYAHFSSNRSSIFCGQKRPNGWGLFDMHGNVSEWCDDITNSTAVICGGSWKDVAEGCRSSNRHRIDPSSRSNGIGFRVVLGQSVQSSALEQNK